MASQGQATGEAFAQGAGGYDPRTTGQAKGEAFARGKSTIIEIHESYQAVQTLENRNPDTRLSYFSRMVLGTKPAKFLFESYQAVMSLTKTAAKHMYDSYTGRQTLIQGKVVEQASFFSVLSLVRSDPGRRALRAWPFEMDGHTFYVLHLGDTGTIVYDRTTGKWSEWQTLMNNLWEANYGINWNAQVIAGAVTGNLIYNVDPNYGLDDRDKPIVSQITAAYPVRMRATIACDEIMVTSSVGYSSGELDNATLTLEISDDRGLTFNSVGTLDLSTATPRTQVSWRSLGIIEAPGRIFRLTDNGGAALSINSIEMFSVDIPNG